MTNKLALVKRKHYKNTHKKKLNVNSSRAVKHIIGYIGDDFYGSDDPTNSVKALKDNSWSVHQVKGQSHQAKPSTR